MISMDWGMIPASPPRGLKGARAGAHKGYGLLARVRTFIDASSHTKIIISPFFQRLRTRSSSLFFAASSPQKLTFWLELTGQVDRYPKIHENFINLVPRAFPSKNGTHFLREKPWGRGWNFISHGWNLYLRPFRPHNSERPWVLSRFEHGYQASTWRTKWLEIDGKNLRCNLKCMVVLVTQIRHHFKAVRDLFLRISDHGLKTQGFHHNHILMLLLIGTSVQDNLILLQHISRGLLAWYLIRRSQEEHFSPGNGLCQDEVFHPLEITMNRELGYEIILLFCMVITF